MEMTVDVMVFCCVEGLRDVGPWVRQRRELVELREVGEVDLVFTCSDFGDGCASWLVYSY
jgi:hypothetical protein